MCAINGYITKQPELKNLEKLEDIVRLAQDRGRDSVGVFASYSNGVTDEYKTIGSLGEDTFHNRLVKVTMDDRKLYPMITLSNNRAEPTTEFVKEKTQEDVQPFTTLSGRITVAHNGTIANDKELRDKEQLKSKTGIDTAYLAEYLDKIWDGTLEHLQKILRDEVVGSFALAVHDQQQFGRLFLATNYKPLYLEFEDNTLYYSSLENYLDTNSSLNRVKNLNNKIIEVPPYTVLSIDQDLNIEQRSLWKTDSVKRVLVVCSGGLDSTVVANHYKQSGFDVTLLHFMYKCRAEDSEVKAIKEIAEFMEVGYMFVDTDIFKNVIKHSRLTETHEDLVTTGDGEASAELAWEWVPARNLIMLSIATGIAEAYKYDVIALGNNLEESGAYPDNEMIFVNKFASVLPYATNLQNRVQIEMPVGNLMKHEIVKKGINENAPLHLTWSCYEKGEKHCGKCGPCYMRMNAFRMNNIKDMLDYKENKGQDFWGEATQLELKDKKWQ